MQLSRRKIDVHAQRDDPFSYGAAVVHQAPSALGVRAAAFARFGPVSLVQFVDFATDVLVINELYASGDVLYSAVAMGFIGFSCFATFVGLVLVYTHREAKVPARRYLSAPLLFLMIPLNLHLVCLGDAISRAEAAFDTEAVHPLQQIFHMGKLIETAAESIPMLCITLIALFSVDEEGSSQRNASLLWASMCLSLLSLTYGFFAYQTDKDTFIEVSAKHKPLQFVALLVDISWTLIVCFTAGPDVVGSAWFLPSFAAVCLALGFCGGVLQLSHSYIRFWKQNRLTALVKMPLYAAVFVFLYTGLQLFFDHPLPPGVMHRWERSHWVPRSNALGQIFIKRPALLLLAVVSLHVTGWPFWRTLLIGVLAPADAVASVLLFHQVGYIETLRAGFRPKRGRVQPEDGQPNSKFKLLRSWKSLSIRTMIAAEKFEAAQSHSWVSAARDGTSQHKLRDMVDAVVRYPTDNGTDGYLQALAALKATCSDLLDRIASADEERLRAYSAKMATYLPSPDGDGTAEDRLRTELEAIGEEGAGALDGERAAERTIAPVADVGEHPLRGVSLGNVLELGIWEQVPSFFKAEADRDAVFSRLWGRSHPSKVVTAFVSHAWKNDGRRKVQMLREFLCLNQLLGQSSVVCLVLAVFMLPLGLAITSYVPAIPFWLLSLVPLAMLATVLAWMYTSIHGCVASRFAPWAFASSTLWLDKCCICQRTPSTVQAGVNGFKKFLLQCDQLIVFASPEYFTRLWCVYELAVFTQAVIAQTQEKKQWAEKKNKELDSKLFTARVAVPDEQNELSRRILLFSLRWPGTFSCQKSDELDNDEEEWFASFRCREAQCFKPSDRGTVLAAIREEWGTETKAGEDAFDEFVQTTLIEVFKHSKQQYQKKLLRTAYRSFELTFGG